MHRLVLGIWLVGCAGGMDATALTPPAAQAPTPDEPPVLPTTERLRIATWNVMRLGHGQKDLEAVADVLDEFDLVAVQEVMTGDVVHALVSQMPEHRVLLTDTPTPTEGTHREYFAFFYRDEVLEPVLNTYVPDPEDAFFRDPYLACFAVVRTTTPLCLLTVHVVFGKRVAERKAEILALGEALRWAQEGDDTSLWIVLGDFNRPVDDGDADDEPEEEWAALLDRRQLRAMVLAGEEVPTTLGKQGWANAYDHVFVSASLRDAVVDAGRYDFVAQVCDGSFERCRARVSDHAPVFVTLELSP